MSIMDFVLVAFSTDGCYPVLTSSPLLVASDNSCGQGYVVSYRLGFARERIGAVHRDCVLCCCQEFAANPRDQKFSLGIIWSTLICRKQITE